MPKKRNHENKSDLGKNIVFDSKPKLKYVTMRKKNDDDDKKQKKRTINIAKLFGSKI